MHLADAFIQSNLQCIQAFISHAFPGDRTHDPGIACAITLLFKLQECIISTKHVDSECFT